MSVLRAEEPPEQSALPQDSARRRAAARWSGPDQVTPATAVPAQAARPEPTPAPAGGQAARAQTPRPQTARDQAVSPPLRLTRRGRVVVAVAAALLLAALSLIIATSAQATNHPVPRAAQNLVQVTVRPGQSLWSVAENADPDADTRVVLQQIIQLNGLTGNVVFAGQRLWVPRG